MSFWIILTLTLLVAGLFFIALQIWFVRASRKIERQYQLELKEIFDKYLLAEADRIIIDYMRRKVIFRPVVEEKDEDEE